MAKLLDLELIRFSWFWITSQLLSSIYGLTANIESKSFVQIYYFNKKYLKDEYIYNIYSVKLAAYVLAYTAVNCDFVYREFCVAHVPT